MGDVWVCHKYGSFSASKVQKYSGACPFFGQCRAEIPSFSTTVVVEEF